MRLYYVRHGQSENNAHWMEDSSAYERVPDPLLTDLGEQQADLVAAFLARSGVDVVEWDDASPGFSGFGITHCYASLMERAVVTGYRIAVALNLPLLSWIDIHETGGMFTYDPETDTSHPEPGRSRGYLQAHYPRLVLPDGVNDSGWWNRPREAPEQMQPRAERVLAELLSRHGGTDDQVVLVSHGGFFNHLICAILGLAETEKLWFTLNNTSITRIDFHAEGRVGIQYVNRRDFLPPELIT
ncbi:MAG: histidine phosphatase family protein [Anaerolineae bacterium]|nr:histidine phosphatase family protein [Anaerolineae bacterium]